MQAIYSDEHRYHGRRLRRQVRDRRDPPEPAGHVLALARRRATTPGSWRRCPTRCPMGVLLRDRDGGEVRVGRDGNPVVKYRLSDYDIAPHAQGHRRRRADPRGGRARSGSSPRTRGWSSYEPGRNGEPRSSSCATPTRAAGMPGRCTYGSFHIMGSARMGGSPRDVRLQPARRDVGRARPLRLRRLRVPDRLGRQPDDLDRVDRAHERVGARCVLALQVRDSS